MWFESLATLLTDNGVASYASNNLFVGSNANIPAGLGPFVSIIEFSGNPTINTHQSSPGYRQSLAKILARSTNYAFARQKAEEAFALFNIYNTTIGGVFFLSITVQGDIADLQLDSQKRPRTAFDVLGVWRL
jgi:Bacteriophage minor capsid protein